MENKYEEGKIYRLVCEDGHYYIGSTIQSLGLRLNKHKTMSKEGVNKIYEYINQIGWENVTIELLEDFPCQSKKELSAREKTLAKEAKNDPLCLNFHEINIYKNGKIYRIQCIDGYYYIGSTTQKLIYRLNHHKQTSKREKTSLYNHVTTLGWEHVIIELVEEYPCETSQQLHAKEDEYIIKHKDDPFCLNINRAHLTIEERKEQGKQYTEAHRQEATERTKQYRQEHHDTILQKEEAYRKAHRAELAEKQREYVKANSDKVKETRKKQYEKNKEAHLAYMKDYKEKNKEKIKEQKLAWQRKKAKEDAELHGEERKKERTRKTEARIARDREIHICECGGTYQLYRKSRHDSSKKHTEFINTRMI